MYMLAGVVHSYRLYTHQFQGGIVADVGATTGVIAIRYDACPFKTRGVRIVDEKGVPVRSVLLDHRTSGDGQRLSLLYCSYNAGNRRSDDRGESKGKNWKKPECRQYIRGYFPVYSDPMERLLHFSHKELSTAEESPKRSCDTHERPRPSRSG